MLVNPFEIKENPQKEQQSSKQPEQQPEKVRKLESSQSDIETIHEVLSKPSQLGVLQQGVDKHFFSDGAFNLIQLLLYVLKQTGPAHVFISTYSIAEDSIATLQRYCDNGRILSIRFLIDNRVRTISPKPFARLVATFPEQYRCLALHAKVVLVWNDEWHISIVGSQNATHNPKLERGIIHTAEQIWNFYKSILDEEFQRGAT